VASLCGSYKYLYVCVYVHVVVAAKSCAELLTRGLEENVNATIDTDGAGGPSQPFTAYCEIKGTTAYTVVCTYSFTYCSVEFV